MKHYKITGVKAQFGPGFVLELSKEQAASRAHALSKVKGNLYTVNAPVMFKHGETLGVAKGDIPKSWWDTVTELTDEADKETAPYTLKHRHFGKYDILDIDGEVVTDEPLPKDDAEAMLADLLGDEG